MPRTGRPGLSRRQKEDLWERWKKGDSFSDIALALGKAPGSVFGVLRLRGGIYAPPPIRSKQSLSLEEREEISRGIALGESIRAIGKRIGRSPSTVSREISKNGGAETYRAIDADNAAWDRAKRPKACKLSQRKRLRGIVAKKLSRNWSPEQISGWLKRTYPNNEYLHVSHETIYRSLFVQARGVLKKELMKHLRSKRLMRHGKAYSTKGKPRGRIIDAISIRERPAEVEDRAIPGHWEGDLIAGSGNTHIATLVERTSRYTVLVKLDGKDTQTVVNALIKQVKHLPTRLRKSLTWDRGAEMAQHPQIKIATNMDMYFCDPQSPWQRGTNENTNRLLRQYFPKKTDLSVYSQAKLNKVAKELNQRPRKTLEYQAPSEILYASVAATN